MTSPTIQCVSFSSNAKFANSNDDSLDANPKRPPRRNRRRRSRPSRAKTASRAHAASQPAATKMADASANISRPRTRTAPCLSISNAVLVAANRSRKSPAPPTAISSKSKCAHRRRYSNRRVNSSLAFSFACSSSTLRNASFSLCNATTMASRSSWAFFYEARATPSARIARTACQYVAAMPNSSRTAAILAMANAVLCLRAYFCSR